MLCSYPLDSFDITSLAIIYARKLYYIINLMSFNFKKKALFSEESNNKPIKK